MATANDTSMSLVSVLGASALVISVHHAYKFDKCKCLIPKKKEWFRVLLTWMLLASIFCLFTWGAGWCYIKYKLGWIYAEGYGTIPYPTEMFSRRYVKLNIPLTIIFNIAFSLQTSLNAEEGLYWYHLMRAVRQPKSARSWLTSSFFYAWIVISIVSTTLQCGIGWIHRGKLNMNRQMATVMAVDGIIEFAVLCAASVVIWKFPAFLDNVKASGAGPEVRSRLHFYHEGNKVRTFFRFLYSSCMMVLGIDGLTKRRLIASTPLASDLLSQMIFGSFFFMLIISVMLYLPRNWSPEGSQRNNIMVGAPRNALNNDHAQLASGVALMSLLREGGQWDTDGMRTKDLQGEIPYNLNDPRMYSSEEPLTSKEMNWELERDSGLGVPNVLENFTSPIAIPVKENNMPTEIRIRVEQEVHEDRGESYV
ncbi:hypothetical protein CNBG_5010 [Cryptococcus deuterogattii R265]|uniref:uncharacterized protein n=1 Tax=Cryptococcus deuterogattii (strain R265) TaxID=294750 RepID=UPI001937CB84|nr:hypothetical protein CNBG_5010 [Cryptococcus deuterogattii R265]